MNVLIQRLAAKRSSLFGIGIIIALFALWAGTNLHIGQQQTNKTCISTTSTLSPTASGTFVEYPMPQPNSDLMSTAIAPDGSVWFGEMGNNALGRLVPGSLPGSAATLYQYTPPFGRDGIMGILADQSGNIWFAEEAGNYIGKFTPANCQFKIFHLPSHGLAISAPNALALDQQGNLWFTEISSASIGMIHTQTGVINQYPLPTNGAAVFPIPYGITVDHQGMVWFSMISSPQIGKLDPASGKITMFPLKTPGAETIAITTAVDGKLWFVIMSGVIGTIDPGSGAIREIAVPASFGRIAQLYDCIVDAHGIVWVTSSGANALLRYDPASDSWQKNALPQAQSSPYGIAQDAQGTLWVTEGNPAANRIAVYHP